MAAGTQPDRRRAVGVLVVAGLVAVMVLAGVVLMVVRLVKPDHQAAPAPSASSSAAPDTGSSEDQLAAAPMLQLPPSAAQPQPLVADTAGRPIRVPRPRDRVVPGGPPAASGFPHTEEGALGQLAAIDEAAFSTTDLARVREVYAWAAAPDAVPVQAWTPMVGITHLVGRLGDGAAQAHATFSVSQGQIKGHVGRDFVVACVLGEMDVTSQTSARAGVGDCQRMVWRDGRWQIGPGAQPAYAPSAWPGSADAVRAGWREIKRVAP